MAARTGVILAAGFGSRLRGVSDDTPVVSAETAPSQPTASRESGLSALAAAPSRPAVATLKPLTLVAGVPLLLRAVQSLEGAGCARVVVVVGHGADDIVGGLRPLHDGPAELVFAHNDRYDLKNGVSVLAARPHLLGEEFVLAMADHVVGDDVMALVRDYEQEPETATLLVDRKLDTIFDMDDATKVRSDGGTTLVAIGKQLEDFDCVDCGVFVGSGALMDAIESFYERNGDASLSEGVQTLAERGHMRVLDIGDGFWQDIDTPEMLAHAERMLAQR